MRIYQILCRNFCLAIATGLLLTACSSAYVGQPVTKPENFYTSNLEIRWESLDEHQDEIAEQIYRFIKNNHPFAAKNFPIVMVEKVSTTDPFIYKNIEEMSIEQKIDTLESEKVSLTHVRELNSILKVIIQKVSDKFAQETSSKNIWKVSLVINEIQPSGGNKEIGAAQGTVCLAGNIAAGNIFVFGGLFICPVNSNRNVVVNAFVTLDEEFKPIEIKGYGAADYSSLFAYDEGEGRRDMMTRAAVAAITHATSELVKLYESKY